MPGLPWVRLDSNIASHDKILALLDERDGAKAAFAYVCSLAYSGGHDTDGLIRFAALPFIHATRRLGDLLVKHDLWVPDPAGWRIKNWDSRQQSSEATEAIRAAQASGGRRGNCIRWHGPDCGCWRNEPDSGLRSVK